MSNTLQKTIRGLSTAGALVSIVFMISIVVLILVEIVLRAVFNSSTLIAAEFSGYFLVALVVMGFAFTFREDAFIRINLLLPRLPETWARVFDVAGALLALAMTVFCTYHAVLMVYESWDLEMTADTMAETPFWIPQIVVPLGLMLLALQLVAFILERAFASNPSVMKGACSRQGEKE